MESKKRKLMKSVWIVEKSKPYRVRIDDEDSVEDILKRNDFGPSTVKFRGQTLRSGYMLRDIETSESYPLEITQNIVHYNYDSRTFSHNYCATDRLSDLLTAVAADDIKSCYLVACDASGTIIHNKRLLKDISTSPTQCITITQRIVHYNYGSRTFSHNYCADDRLSDLLTAVAAGNIESCYLVARDASGTIIHNQTLLKDISTSPTQCITISPYYGWFKCEDDSPTAKLCNPDTFLANIDFFQFNMNTRALYYRGNRLEGPYPMLRDLSLSKQNPLIIKEVRGDVYVDSVLSKVTMSVSDTLKVVIQKAAKLVKRTLNTCGFDCNHSEVHNLNDFILETQVDRALYLTSVKPPGPSYNHGGSVSTVAKSNPNTISKYSTEYQLFAHWFCLKIYNKFNESPDNEAKTLSLIFEQIMNYNVHSALLQPDELSYTSMLCRELDRYLFPNRTTGCLIHQPVICGENKNRPDGYGAKLNNDQPSQPILVYDFTPNDFEIAEVESLGYCQTICNALGKFQPMFVMPCTKHVMSLLLCWPMCKSRHALIKICEVKDDPRMFASFFHAVKFAIENFTFPTHPFAVEPIKGVVLRNCLRPPSKQLKSGEDNVYLDKGVVYKLFDTKTKPYAKPNVSIIQEILGENYLPFIKEEDLSDDKVYKCLTYGYIYAKEDDEITIQDFRPIMKALDALHEQSYVHSDVRFYNMVFPKDSNIGAKLIDFDLMDKVDEPYPLGYNQELSERHSGAVPCWARKIIHDRHSLIFVILNTVKTITDEEGKQLKKFQDSESPKLETFFR